MPSSKVPAGHFHLLYFASAKSHAKKESEYLEAPLPLSKLFAVLDGKYAGMAQQVLSSCMVTINLDYVDIPDVESGEEDVLINEGDEVAIIPPVSSG